MLRRILVANRGEIAVRVIRACREMGIESVAVFSDADRRARHTAMADHAVRIGPAPAVESYLSIPAILEAARSAGADGVHPGYGFLSESDTFAQACLDAGLAFIGPPPAALAAMGSKIAARQLAERAGVPIVPGGTPRDQSDAALRETAAAVGYPLLVKPSEGGGGIGMKVVRSEPQLLPAVAQARREALAAFGDGTLYVERLVQHPRHVEFQVIADDHGHAVHLFERECSIQRRHQKVLEETPSPALTPALRRRMGDAAVRLARAAGYRNAGTVEFLVDGAGDDAPFYFLEMNARLQVEHPITEAVVGVDLVRAQILVAAGLPLPWTQDELRQRGHAFEARIYAEDPARGHLPQAGRLALYREPAGPGIRVDSGVIEGADVSVHYDPLLAKLVASGETRDIARRRAEAALRDFPILGVRTNVPFLLALLAHPRVVGGDVDTTFLDEEGDSLLAGIGAIPPEVVTIAALERQAGHAPASVADSHDPWQELRNVRV